MEIPSQEVIDAYRQNLSEAQHQLLLSQLSNKQLMEENTKLKERLADRAEVPSEQGLNGVAVGPRQPAVHTKD
jgi:hypothetical protein